MHKFLSIFRLTPEMPSRNPILPWNPVWKPLLQCARRDTQKKSRVLQYSWWPSGLWCRMIFFLCINIFEEHTVSRLRIVLSPDDWDSTFLQNAGIHKIIHSSVTQKTTSSARTRARAHSNTHTHIHTYIHNSENLKSNVLQFHSFSYAKESSRFYSTVGYSSLPVKSRLLLLW
jgi:hypothetical protein